MVCSRTPGWLDWLLLQHDDAAGGQDRVLRRGSSDAVSGHDDCESATPPRALSRHGDTHPKLVGCWTATHRVQSRSIIMMKPARFPPARATTRPPAEAGCRTAARRVQTMIMMKTASTPRAATSAIHSRIPLPGGGQQSSDDDDEAGELPAPSSDIQLKLAAGRRPTECSL